MSGWQQQQQQQRLPQFNPQFPQQTGFQPQFLSSQPTGYGGQQPQFQSNIPPVPQLPNQFQQQQQQPQPTGYSGFTGSGFQQPQPQRSAAALLNPQAQFLSQSPGLQSQPTGAQGLGGQGLLQAQATGWGGQGPLVAQPTGFTDPRMAMLSSTFMPTNMSAPYLGGAPQLNQSVPNLQQSIQQHNIQNQGAPTAKISWALGKEERKQYDKIFRAWDAKGTGFITGDAALSVFGQSGLSQDDLARIWYVPNPKHGQRRD